MTIKMPSGFLYIENTITHNALFGTHEEVPSTNSVFLGTSRQPPDSRLSWITVTAHGYIHKSSSTHP